jgi:hypothetical protein
MRFSAQGRPGSRTLKAAYGAHVSDSHRLAWTAPGEPGRIIHTEVLHPARHDKIHGAPPSTYGTGAAGVFLIVRVYPVVQAVPLTVNAVGEALLAVQVPWKPKEVEPPTGTLAL